VEESLVGTSGQSLISDLYHGKLTNTIKCCLCGKVSEHSEDFLDLCVSVSSSSKLEDSLAQMFLKPEVLDASNRYRCDACGELTDAVKYTRVRHLPPVLTVSLLRFNYDPVKMQRYKETGRFEFPLTLDMSCFCDSGFVGKSGGTKCGGENIEEIDTARNGFGCGDELHIVNMVSGDLSSQLHTEFSHVYELFSVIVHRGGTHGGHYHAIIHDLEGRGTWTQPDERVSSTTTSSVSLAEPVSSSIVPELDFSSPRCILTFILQNTDSTSGMSLSELSCKLSEVTGESWRKRYKHRHGSFVKFIADNSDLFVYDSAREQVSLASNFGQIASDSIKDEASYVPVPAHIQSGSDKVEVNGTSGMAVVFSHDVSSAACKETRQQLQLERKGSSFPDISSPCSVITSILLDAGADAGLSVMDLCSKIAAVTGDSWRKRYKPKHGSLVKFFSENSDMFVHDVNGCWVTLRSGLADGQCKVEGTERPDCNGNSSGDLLADAVQHAEVSSSVAKTKVHSRRKRKKAKLKPASQELASASQNEKSRADTEVTTQLSGDQVPKPGHCWFDFNDASICAVRAESLEKSFGGKECAYMLFYRAIPTADSGSVSKSIEIPDWLISELVAENLRLDQQRAEYENFLNIVKVELHFGRSYEYWEGVLRPRIGTCYYVEHTVDIRQDVYHLLSAVADLGGELFDQCHTVHIAKCLPFGGLHLYWNNRTSIRSVVLRLQYCANYRK